MQNRHNAHAQLIRQIESVSRLDEEDRQALRGLVGRVRVMDANTDVFREGQPAKDCCLILSGVACRYKIVGGGRRQIVSFHFAGDIPDLQSLLLDRMDHNLGVLTGAEVALIPHDAMRELARQRPGLANAFSRQALVDSSIFREWIANIGRRLALERVAHLICECFERMRVLGLATDNTFELPITQSELADATGLSNVHINRTLQALRQSDLISSHGRVHTILNWPKMRETADFDAAYLHLLPPRAA